MGALEDLFGKDRVKRAEKEAEELISKAATLTDEELVTGYHTSGNQLAANIVATGFVYGGASPIVHEALRRLAPDLKNHTYYGLEIARRYSEKIGLEEK